MTAANFGTVVFRLGRLRQEIQDTSKLCSASIKGVEKLGHLSELKKWGMFSELKKWGM